MPEFYYWLSLDNKNKKLILSGLYYMARHKHPKKEVELALQYAEAYGWRIDVGGAHAWGKMYCPINDTTCRCGEFCITSIWSSPRNSVNHAKQILRVVNNCHRFEKLN